jgi:ParB family chromosome partitioning protein
MAIENRLSKGLGALLGATPTVSASRGGGTLPVSLMKGGAFQPRQAAPVESLEDLTASIKAKGVIQPILVRPMRNGPPGGPRYEIIAGERRWQAAKLAGLTDIPTIVRDVSDEEALALALIENIQRESLSATDEARALKRLADEFGMTQQAVADTIGRSRVSVTNLIRLLDLPQSVIALVDSQALSMGHARALLGLEEPAQQVALAERVVSKGLSVRDTEKAVRELLSGAATAPRRSPPELSVISEVFKTASVRVQLHQRTSGAGKIVAEFKDPKSRDALLDLIKTLNGD